MRSSDVGTKIHGESSASREGNQRSGWSATCVLTMSFLRRRRNRRRWSRRRRTTAGPAIATAAAAAGVDLDARLLGNVWFIIHIERSMSLISTQVEKSIGRAG